MIELGLICLFSLTRIDESRLFIGGLVVLIAVIMGIAFGTVWYFTKYENNAIERSIKAFAQSLENGINNCVGVFYSVKNRVIPKSEL